MSYNDRKNGVLSLFKGVFKNKREDCADIITQAEKIIADYICKRRNEIADKYCKSRNSLKGLGAGALIMGGIYLLYTLLM